MSYLRRVHGIFTVVGLLSIPMVVAALPITVPSGVAPGSTYFLVFVTAETRDALSPDIADYDAFVTAQANLDPTLAALATTWRVIGSTPTIDAFAHLGLSGPIFNPQFTGFAQTGVPGPVFNLQGQEVALGLADLLDGGISAPIQYDQAGNLLQARVWTGSSYIGSRGITLGSNIFRSGYGQSDQLDRGWIYSGTDDPEFFTRSMYGVSAPLTAPEAVPEPSTIVLMTGPLLVLVPAAYRRWRQHRSDLT